MSQGDKCHHSLDGSRVSVNGSTTLKLGTSGYRLPCCNHKKQEKQRQEAKRQRHREEGRTGTNCRRCPSCPPLCILEFGLHSSSCFLENQHAQLSVMPQLSQGQGQLYRGSSGCTAEPKEPMLEEEERSSASHLCSLHRVTKDLEIPQGGFETTAARHSKQTRAGRAHCFLSSSGRQMLGHPPRQFLSA